MKTYIKSYVCHKGTLSQSWVDAKDVVISTTLKNVPPIDLPELFELFDSDFRITIEPLVKPEVTPEPPTPEDAALNEDVMKEIQEKEGRI